MLELQNSYAIVRKKMRLHRIPQELIDIIFEMIMTNHKKQVTREIGDVDEYYSVWWNPSDELLSMCRDNGALQIGYYDTRSLFDIYPTFWELSRQQFSVFDDEDEIDDEIEEHFNHVSCGGARICYNCVCYNFPCRNKVMYSRDFFPEHDPGNCISSPERIQGAWDIKSDPRIAQLLTHEDLNEDVPNYPF
jgi:hypothetical protein